MMVSSLILIVKSCRMSWLRDVCPTFANKGFPQQLMLTKCRPFSLKYCYGFERYKDVVFGFWENILLSPLVSKICPYTFIKLD